MMSAKKVIVVLTLLLASLTARGQLYLGGGIGIGSDYGNRGGIAFTFAPDISYRVSNNFLVGAQASYRTGYDRLAVTPYARWHILPLEGIMSIFVSASAPFEFYPDYTTLGVRLRPGIAIRVSQGVYMLVHIGSFGYSEVFQNGRHYGDWIAAIDGNNISVGFCVGL
ncbi:MAG: hypothetical protein MJZ17_07655 [Bacteroidales bacterium]|nr:hypothetical protein [Bacteroidales bacterium]